jgi:hypothetical protein
LCKRNEAISTGVLLTSSEDYVPAKIRFRDKTVRARIRLKGDWTEHLEGFKWSFRISLKGGETLFGMREFSIQHPKTRNFIYEWIFHQALRREEIIALQYDFIDVTLNRRNLGLYAIEEHFDKRLIENNGYREGPIIKFDEDLLWANRQRDFNLAHDQPYYASAIEVFQPKKIKSSKNLKELYNTAYNLLERFRNGELPTCQVFDSEKMACYYALSDLLGAHHMAYYHNLRFYFNPITSKLEPIGFDGMAGEQICTLLGIEANKTGRSYGFEQTLFSDKDFMKIYLSELNRISKPTYLHQLFKDIQNNLDRMTNILYREFSDHLFTDLSLRRNRNFIYKTLNPIKGIHAYLETAEGPYLTLRLGNLHCLPVEVQGISHNGFILFRPVKETLLPGKIFFQPVEYQKIRFKAIGEHSWTDKIIEELEIEFSVLNTDYKKVVKIFSWPHYNDQFLDNDLIRQKSNLNEFPFLLEINTEKKEIFIKPKKHTLKRDLIIPEGFVVVAPIGMEINLLNGAKILSYSPFWFIGSEENPIIIKSSDYSGQGIAVLNAKNPSRFEHVIFKNLSAPKHLGWELTGAVTFYESPVNFFQCQFIFNKNADDFLNIIRSDFDLRKSQFYQTYADAIDFDYCRGTISNLIFKDCGNDALDFSGSYVTIDKVYIEGARDKGLSVGEASYVTAKKINIRDTKTAFASKDSSVLELEDINLQNCDIGFIAFQKKPEFGPAQIKVAAIMKKDVRKTYLAEKRSKLIVDGKVIEQKQ